MPKIHPETKVLIIKRLKTRSTADVADTFNVSQRQVQRIKKRFEETGDVFDKPRSGRPRKTTAREDRLLARKSKASPCSTATELHETWSPEVPVSTRTVCRILSRNCLHGRISAQKPPLNKRELTVKRQNRVAFAKAHSLLKGWTLEKWQKVDFSDESSVELHHSLRKYCKRPTGARMDLRFIQKTVKFGGGKIMVWGYIQYGGVREICRVEGNINSLKYQEILATFYIPNHKRGQILQQDGAPSHTSISTSKFLKAKKIKMLQDWPAQSPDMNIIEHVWVRMKKEAWKTKPKNIDELWEACKTAFFAIPNDFINKLYESLPNRMDAVLQAHGSHTRY
uniref:Transposase n=1 Tax=Denticeps clupeoides TaxID=299321 RepID=A0AAY4A283_9TELE